MWRTLIAQWGRINFHIAYTLMDQVNYQEARKFIEDEGGPPNVELAKQIYPYTKLAIQVIFVARIILFLLALKWMRLTKVFFYFE